ncbi:MAG: hypothetical protein GY909_04680 [Oligoflexia bacterium]|nr:hypothetical protein [Oligoflexia bacterium]
MVADIRLNEVSEKLAHLKSLESIPSINPRKYDANETYLKLDFIEHANFGRGFVTEVLSEDKIKVFFANGEETIDHRNALI